MTETNEIAARCTIPGLSTDETVLFY